MIIFLIIAIISDYVRVCLHVTYRARSAVGKAQGLVSQGSGFMPFTCRWRFEIKLGFFFYDYTYCAFSCILRRLWRLYGLYLLKTYHFTITGFILHYTFIPIMTITLIISSTWERLITWGVYSMIACRFLLLCWPNGQHCTYVVGWPWFEI